MSLVGTMKIPLPRSTAGENFSPLSSVPGYATMLRAASRARTGFRPSSSAIRRTTGGRSRKRFVMWKAITPSGFMCRR
jgi:hypothetical protein